MSKERKHLIWILIDSARNFQSEGDDRGLPQSVVNFAKGNVYFKNVVTSAPSTIQSISSMMTSSPSSLLARSYNNYRGIMDCFDYFPHLLKNDGYDILGAVYFKHGREIMSDQFGLIPKHFFPKGLSHRKEVWENEDVYELGKNIIDQHNWSKPTMLYLHYNVRIDVNISEIVQETLNRIEDAGLMKESVVMINSDHGYPAPDRGWDAEEAKKEGWGHDQQVFNDNILTPWVISSSELKQEEIEDYVGTIDIVPTLCELLNVKPSEKFKGINALDPELRKIPRILRTDNRYVGQVPAYTSFIYKAQKAILYKDKSGKDSFSYFDLIEDPKEVQPIEFAPEYAELQKKVEENIQQTADFHRSLLKDSWSSLNQLDEVKNAKRIGMYVKSSKDFEKIALDAINEAIPDKNILLVNSESEQQDLILVVIESEVPWQFKSLASKVRKLKTKTVIFIDNNGTYFGTKAQLKLYKEFFRKRKTLFQQDRWFVFDLAKRVLFKKLLKPIK